MFKPSRFGSVVAHPDLNGEVSGSSPGLENASHNELE